MRLRLITTILIMLFLTGCYNKQLLETNPMPDKNKVFQPNYEVLDEIVLEEPEHFFDITISAVGDCTLGVHEPQLTSSISFIKIYEKNNKDTSYFFKNVKDILDDDDLTIANLETTLTTATKKPEKAFNFKGYPEFTGILTDGSVEAVNIANNHIYDYYQKGYNDTKKYLKEANILYFGEGDYAIYEVKDVKIGLLGYNAFSNFDSIKKDIKDKIAILKEENCELIIISFHWGIEREYYPMPSQVDLGRYAIDEGADLVLGHHPHVLQGIEQYKNKNIVYSLANFCFGGNLNPKDKDTIIYQQKFRFSTVQGKVADSPLQYKVIPCSVSSIKEYNNYQPTPLEGKEAERVINRVKKYSEKLNKTN